MPHNIEKLPGKAHYTGYGSGAVWHISKTNSSYGNWIARDQNAQGLQPVYAFTLKEMSHKIEDAKTRNTREPSTSYTTSGKKNPTDADAPTRRQWFGMIYDTCWRKGIPVETQTLKRFAGDAAWKRGDGVLTVVDKIEKHYAKKTATVTGKKNPRLTLSALNKEAKPLGLIVTRNEDGEYRVAFKSNREASAYYTDDIEDAQGTMRAMAKEGDRHTVRGAKNPTRKKAVELSAMYIEGIKEARDELKMLRREFPTWTDATIFAERAALNVKTAEKLMAQAPKGSPQYDFIMGQRDFWEGKRVLTVRGAKNPAPKSSPYVIRAHHENGTVYYFAGGKLNTSKKSAERFAASAVDAKLKWLEDRLPKTIKYCDAVQA